MSGTYPKAAAIAAALGASLLSTSCWYVKQPYRFLAERARAVPVSKLAADPGSSAELIGFLSRIEDVREYTVERLGMRPTGNYTKYVALDKDYVADVVSACASDSFERHLWRYPFVGALPYKGFYDRKDAEREAARLKKAGLDVILRGVDAFSSLGYFKDPLYSFMADYDVDVIAEIVFHESAHATLFVKGAEQFNEEFATFVGRKAAELYVADRFGPDSAEAKARRTRAADSAAFTAFLQGTAALLEAAYAEARLARAPGSDAVSGVGPDAGSGAGTGGSAERPVLKEKARIIAERAAEFSRIAPSAFSDPAYSSFDMGSINNAYIDLYRLYEEDLGLYERWFAERAGGSLPEFVSSLSMLAKSAGSGVKDAMRKELEGR